MSDDDTNPSTTELWDKFVKYLKNVVNTILGVDGATPNGRKAGEPISHGANRHAGFREVGADSAMSVVIVSVQSYSSNAN